MYNRFASFINRSSVWCGWLSCAAVLAMMCIVIANVVVRFFGLTIVGTYEYVILISSVLVSFALVYTTMIGGHVAVDLVMRRFSQRTQGIVGAITGVLSVIMFGMITVRLGRFAHQNMTMNLVTETAEIPLYPFMFGATFALVVCCFLLVVGLIKSVSKAVSP